MARGRKRKMGKREPNGRISRADTQRDVREVALSQPHRRWLPEGKRSDQGAECIVGSAYLASLITEPQSWAAAKYRRLVDEFHQVLATPVTRQSASAVGVTASLETPAEADHLAAIVQETPEERAERVIETMNAVTRLFGKLDDGKSLRRELDAVVLEGAPITSLAFLRAALGELARLWRLDVDARPTKRAYFWRGERPECMELAREA